MVNNCIGIITAPKTPINYDSNEDIDIINCSLFQNHIYKNFPSSSFNELLSNEIENYSGTITHSIKKKIHEQYTSIYDFEKKNISDIKALVNECVQEQGPNKTKKAIDVFRYLCDHSNYPLMSNKSYTRFYVTVLSKILEICSNKFSHTKEVVDCFNFTIPFLFNVTKVDIKCIIEKFYELCDNKRIERNFFDEWEFHIITHTVDSMDCLKVDSKKEIVNIFPEMKPFLDEVVIKKFNL